MAAPSSASSKEDGHDVTVAPDGKLALDVSLQNGHDVIILDIGLPNVDGFEICRRLRTAGVQTPVLMMTARVEVDDRVHGLDSDADDYITKPFAVAELLARVRALGRRTPRFAEPHDRLAAGDLTLHVGRHSAVRAGREIELTVKEFQLLELLLRHQGEVLTREQILDQVLAVRPSVRQQRRRHLHPLPAQQR